jgi:hypothetical protein
METGMMNETCVELVSSCDAQLSDCVFAVMARSCNAYGRIDQCAPVPHLPLSRKSL